MASPKSLQELKQSCGPELWADVSEYLDAKLREQTAGYNVSLKELVDERTALQAALAEHQRLSDEAYDKAAPIVQQLYSVLQSVGTPVRQRKAAQLAEQAARDEAALAKKQADLAALNA